MALSLAAGGDIGAPAGTAVRVGAWELAPFEQGFVARRGDAEWRIRISDLGLAKHRAKYGTESEGLPSVVGTDSSRELVFLAAALDSGTNVPLLLLVLDLRRRRVEPVLEAYGSGIGDCSLSPDGETLACRIGSHASACRSFARLLLASRRRNAEFSGPTHPRVRELREHDTFVNETPAGWDANGRLKVTFDTHRCTDSLADPRYIPVRFTGLLDLSAGAYAE